MRVWSSRRRSAGPTEPRWYPTTVVIRIMTTTRGLVRVRKSSARRSRVSARSTAPMLMRAPPARGIPGRPPGAEPARASTSLARPAGGRPRPARQESGLGEVVLLDLGRGVLVGAPVDRRDLIPPVEVGRGRGGGPLQCVRLPGVERSLLAREE